MSTCMGNVCTGAIAYEPMGRLDPPAPGPDTGDLHRTIPTTPRLASESDAKLVISL